MRALILAAGRGTRLAPLTDELPKCLVKLGGISLLTHQVATLRSQSISDITVVAGYRAEQLQAQGFQVVVNHDYETSNMVYTLFCAAHLMEGGGDLIISYGDIVYEPRVLKSLLACEAPMCVVVDREWRRYWEMRMEDPLSDAETMKIDEQGIIAELGKKPGSYVDIQGQYIGLIKVDQEQIAALRQLYDELDPQGVYDGKSRKQMYMTSFIQQAIDSGWQVQAVPIDNGWLEVDTHADLQLYHRMEIQGILDTFYRRGEAQVESASARDED